MLSRVVVAVMALVAQGDQSRVAQCGEDVPDPRGRGVVRAARQLSGYPQDLPVWGGDDLQVHPVHPVLARVVGPVGGDTVDRDKCAVDDHEGHGLACGLPQRFPQLGCPYRQQFEISKSLARQTHPDQDEMAH